MRTLNPIQIGIMFNLFMVAMNFTIPFHSTVGRWYFETNGPVYLMGAAWVGFVAWAIAVAP